ncbi:helix-turn-helix domain-containing protein, partial [Candidatus Omnitrophota bacterium]
MGVVYKFKDEIKKFIVVQKQQNPRMSCRKLATIVNKRFSIRASKSSINNVMKQAGLSSRVGRPKEKKASLGVVVKGRSQGLPQPPKSLLIELKTTTQAPVVPPSQEIKPLVPAPEKSLLIPIKEGIKDISEIVPAEPH